MVVPGDIQTNDIEEIHIQNKNQAAMIEEESIHEQIIRLLQEDATGLSIDVKTRLAMEEKSNVKILNKVLLNRDDAYAIYKMRDYNMKQQNDSSVIGYDELLLNLRNTELDKISIVGIQIGEDRPMLIFVDENITCILGFVQLKRDEETH